jgi:hypothetical protein
LTVASAAAAQIALAGCHAPALLQEHAHAHGAGSARQLHQEPMAMQHRMAMPPAEIPKN